MNSDKGGMSEEKIASMKAAAERNKSLLEIRKEEFNSVSSFLKDLETQRVSGKQRINTLVPMFGGAAMMPAQLVLDGRAAEPGVEKGEEKDFVLTWLGTDLFARTDVDTALKLLKVRLGDVEDAIEEITRGMKAMSMVSSDEKSSESIDLLAAAKKEMEDSGVMEICEPISESDALKEIPRPTTKDELAELERMNKTVSFGHPEKDSDMDAFFKAMEEQEAHWNEMCQVKESIGEDIDENHAAELAYDVAAKMWPRKKKMPENVIPESRREQHSTLTDASEAEQNIQQPMMADAPEQQQPPVRFEPIVKEQKQSQKSLDDQIKSKVVDDPFMSRTVVEHPDGAEMVEKDIGTDSEDDAGAMETGDDDDTDSDEDENMIIKPKNPMSFVPRNMLHTSIPKEVLEYQREQLEREDALRKQKKLPPVTSSTKFNTLPLKVSEDGSDEDDMFRNTNDDEDDDLVCFAHADGHASMPPIVHSSHH